MIKRCDEHKDNVDGSTRADGASRDEAASKEAMGQHGDDLKHTLRTSLG